MEKIPTYTFAFPVQYLRLGDLQLHLFERDTDAPEFHHIGINVDDFEDAYRRAKELGSSRARRSSSHCTSSRTAASRCTSAIRRGTSWSAVGRTCRRSTAIAWSSSAWRIRCPKRRRRAERPLSRSGEDVKPAPFEYHAGDGRRRGRAARPGKRDPGARRRPESRAAHEVPHREAERARRRELRRGSRCDRGARRRAARGSDGAPAAVARRRCCRRLAAAPPGGAVRRVSRDPPARHRLWLARVRGPLGRADGGGSRARRVDRRPVDTGRTNDRRTRTSSVPTRRRSSRTS